MSVFSSLNYLLTRGVAAINQTYPSQDEPRQETMPSNNLSLDFGNESSIINTTGPTRPEHLNFGAFTSFVEAKINSTLVATSQNWAQITGLPTSVSDTLLETENTFSQENDNQFSTETYPNADHLLESWWNIFDPRYLRNGWGMTLTLIIAYMLILVVGVIGNIMVILVVLLRPQMRSVTNMFIFNLAIADFFVIVFCVPSTLLANIFAPWILGTFMCKAVAYVQGVSVCAAAYSLAAISFDRCQAVYRNYERPRGFSRKTCAITVFLIWVAAISLTIPWAVIFEVKVSEYDGLRYCVETWENEEHGKIYFLVVNFLCFYAIPFALIFVSNWFIYCHVSKRKVPQDSISSASSAPLRKMHRETRRHVLRMLGIVTLTFLISWLPVYILMIFVKFSQNISESEYKVIGILMPIAQWLGTVNSSINPILYAFLNKKFRKMFVSILPAWIPVNSIRKYVLLKNPTFANTLKEKSLKRGISNTKTNIKEDEHKNSKFGSNTNSQDDVTPILVPEKVQIVVCTISDTPVVSICKPVIVYNARCGERATVDTVAHL